MMDFKDACCESEQVLARVEGQCQSVLINLGEFDEYVASYAVNRLSSRLAALAQQVESMAKEQYQLHGLQGHVFVFMREGEGITVYWVEREAIVADRARYKTYGWEILSVDETVGTIKDMMKRLVSGHWEVVVDWVGKYGRPR